MGRDRWARLWIVVAIGVGAFLARAEAQPATYDVRNFNWLTPVTDQGDLGTCWAFAATNAFRSSFLRTGFVTDPNSPALAVSQWHMATRNGNQPDLTYPYDNWGGSRDYAIAYLARGRGDWLVDSGGTIPNAGGGAVLVGANPLNAYPLQAAENQENLAPYIPPASQPIAYILKTAQIFDQTNGRSDADQVTYVKNAVIQFGAIGTSMFYTGSSFHSSTNTYFYNGSEADANHDVVIAGWDDSVVVQGAANPGAWLIQNSWGSNWADQGFFWISYEDKFAGKDGVTSYEARPLSGLNEVVLQNQIKYADKRTGAGAGTDSKAVSILTPTENAFLASIGVITDEDGASLTLNVYSDWDPVTGPSGLLATMNQSFAYRGYHLITLDSALALNQNDSFVVEIDYGSAFANPIAYEKLDTAAAGLSFWFDPSQNVWVDLAALGTDPGVFFVKALTVPEPGTGSLVFVAIVVGVGVGRRWRQKPA